MADIHRLQVGCAAVEDIGERSIQGIKLVIRRHDRVGIHCCAKDGEYGMEEVYIFRIESSEWKENEKMNKREREDKGD